MNVSSISVWNEAVMLEIKKANDRGDKEWVQVLLKMLM